MVNVGGDTMVKVGGDTMVIVLTVWCWFICKVYQGDFQAVGSLSNSMTLIQRNARH